MVLHVQSAAYHRNGSFGAGYHSLRFRAHVDGQWQSLGAIVFDQAEHVAIMDDDGASWRCEEFEPQLRAFIASPAGEWMIWRAVLHGGVANEA